MQKHLGVLGLPQNKNLRDYVASGLFISESINSKSINLPSIQVLNKVCSQHPITLYS